ncbi:hypothetical protein JXQ70_11565 [bacterium]|nr:hypothetical protein [bacterium]
MTNQYVSGLTIGLLLTTFCTLFVTMSTPAYAGPKDMNPQKSAPPELNRMQPDQLPTPFSAEQIRDFCKNGRKIMMLIEVPGKAPMLQVTDFANSTDEIASLTSYNMDLKGTLIGEKQTSQKSWKDLQAHAAFPAVLATVRSDMMQLSIGKYDCWFYTMTEEKDGKKEINSLWFAKDLPGPPILYRKKIDGTIALTMSMVKTGLEKPTAPAKPAPTPTHTQTEQTPPAQPTVQQPEQTSAKPPADPQPIQTPTTNEE